MNALVKTTVFSALTLALLAGLIAAAVWLPGGSSGSVRAQPPPVIVGFDMDTTGNSCPGDGTDCSLGEINDCVEVHAATEDAFDVDVFLEGLPLDESILGAAYSMNFPHAAVNVIARTHNSDTVNLIAQPGSMLIDLSETPLPDTVSPHEVNMADFGAAEYNPPFTHGVLGRYTFKVLPTATAGVYALTIDPATLVLGRDVPPGGELCYYYGCDIWDGNWDPQYGLIAIDTACPGVPVEYTLSMAAAPPEGGTTDPPLGDNVFPEGAVVPLSAFPNPGWLFDSWSGDPDCLDGSVTMDANKSCTANFIPTGVIVVEIDIKPGSWPNSINLKSKGLIPVAILTTASFDATQVDSDTVRFAGAAPVRWALEDVDGDGDIDLVLHFRTRETDIAPGDTEACLTGQTYDGIFIEGCDSIRLVPASRTRASAIFASGLAPLGLVPPSVLGVAWIGALRCRR